MYAFQQNKPPDLSFAVFTLGVFTIILKLYGDIRVWDKIMELLEIKIKGLVERDWSSWMRDFSVTFTEQGETVLMGLVQDQSALYGLLDRLSDLGIQLISVNRKVPETEDYKESV